MATKLLMIHGRGQASDAHTSSDPELLKAHIFRIERTFLAGLAKGLILSGLQPIPESGVVFPFYANAFADAIMKFETSGGSPPDLEMVAANDQRNVQKLAQLQAEVRGGHAHRRPPRIRQCASSALGAEILRLQPHPRAVVGH